ncbi:60S ribosomal protein L4 [Myotis davidii]|uniref:60S ribosomal protein L4 n=1 Tax=Myotis davidii TaxID=225400 RepID=L5M7Y2_MYODS|nr:60S ribosomal protein L4 [Myotis davidii]
MHCRVLKGNPPKTLRITLKLSPHAKTMSWNTVLHQAKHHKLPVNKAAAALEAKSDEKRVPGKEPVVGKTKASGELLALGRVTPSSPPLPPSMIAGWLLPGPNLKPQAEVPGPGHHQLPAMIAGCPCPGSPPKPPSTIAGWLRPSPSLKPLAEVLGLGQSTPSSLPLPPSSIAGWLHLVPCRCRHQ